MQKIERPLEEQSSTLTRKGQVTIPVAIRRLLGVGPKDKISFVVQDDTVQLRRGVSVAERTAGMLKGPQPALSPKEEREAAADAIAEGALERMGE
jgi:antitoxin PrlF